MLGFLYFEKKKGITFSINMYRECEEEEGAASKTFTISLPAQF